MELEMNMNQTPTVPVAPPLPPTIVHKESKVVSLKSTVPPEPVLLFDDWFFQSSQTSVKYNRFQYLKQHQITHIICLTEADPNYLSSLESEFQFKLFSMKDAEGFPLDETVEQVLEYILLERQKNSNSKFVVHCLMGVSRSVAIACACIMKWNRWSYQQAIEYIREKRVGQSTLPNQGFVHYLQYKLLL